MNNKKTLRKYEVVKKKLTQILEEKTLNFLTCSINSFHLIKPHDYYINKNIFFINNIFLLIFLSPFRIIYRFLKWFFKLIENYYFIFFYKNKKIKKNENEIYIFSYMNSEKLEFNTNNDFIYGKIPFYIKNKYRIKFIYLNNTSLNSRLLNYKYKNVIILDNIFPLLKEIKIFYFQLSQLNLFLFKHFLKKKITLNFFIRIIISIFSYKTRLNLRYHLQFIDFFKIYNAKIILTTFEGFAWEKLLFNVVKTNSANCKVAAYQHIGLLKNQFDLKYNKKNNNFNPDYILTCSVFNKKKIIKLMPNLKKKVFNIGSGRYFIKKRTINKKIKCLILPEGIHEECIYLFKYSLQLALKFPKVQFIWRTHPLINISKFIKNNFLKDSFLLKNIILSKISFNDDIARSDIVIYRGSTSIINAIDNGKIPIYYKKKDDIFNIDPSYDFSIKKIIVTTVNDFQEVLRKYKYYCKYYYNNRSINTKFFTTQSNSSIKNIFNNLTKN